MSTREQDPIFPDDEDFFPIENEEEFDDEVLPDPL